jgi:hypothetical protein
MPPKNPKVFFFLKKEVARGGERTRILSISFIFSFSPLYRWATAARHPNPKPGLIVRTLNESHSFVESLKILDHRFLKTCPA